MTQEQRANPYTQIASSHPKPRCTQFLSLFKTSSLTWDQPYFYRAPINSAPMNSINHLKPKIVSWRSVNTERVLLRKEVVTIIITMTYIVNNHTISNLPNSDIVVMDSRTLHCGNANFQSRRVLMYLTIRNPRNFHQCNPAIPAGSKWADMELLLSNLRS